MNKSEQNTESVTRPPDAPVGAPAESPTAIEAGAPLYRKVMAHAANSAPPGLRPIGGVLAGIIAGLEIE